MDRRGWTALSAAGAMVCAVLAGASGASAAAVSGTGLGWNTAQTVPGLWTGVSDGDEISSVACQSSGNCTIAGDYNPANSFEPDGFTADEKNGQWASTVQLPGTNSYSGPRITLNALACAGPGDCTAGGSMPVDPYLSHTAPIVTSEQNGTWGKPQELPGIAALESSGIGETDEVSCWSAGNCTAVGVLRTDSGTPAGIFTAAEKNGTWQDAARLPVPGHPAAGSIDLSGLSCGPGGNCAVTGDDAGRPFTVDEVNGAWRAGRVLSGFPAGARGVTPEPVSCPASGDCAVSGTMTLPAAAGQEAFVVTEAGGTWGNPRPVADMADAGTVSCAAPGSCVAAGEDNGDNVVLATQAHGTWGRARALPGLARLNTGKQAWATSVSCPKPGYCGVTGLYTEHASPGGPRAFVDTAADGTWGTALEVPGAASLISGPGSGGGAISCTYPLACTAVGWGDGGSTAFTVSTKSVNCDSRVSRPAGEER